MSGLSADDREYLRESRRNSGVPERVTDLRAIEQIAGLVLNSPVMTRAHNSDNGDQALSLVSSF